MFERRSNSYSRAGKTGKILLKYCNEVIYKLMVGVNESPKVSTEGHILERWRILGRKSWLQVEALLKRLLPNFNRE